MAGFPEHQDGVLYLTEGGQETEIMYKHGHDLPEFAMFPLLDNPRAEAVDNGHGTAGPRAAASIGPRARPRGGRFLMARKNANGLKPAKSNLPQKACATCARPFTWRKKWARDWDQVKFCSDKCRATAAKA